MMDEKLVTPLISALVGGVIGSGITAYANHSLWRRQQQSEASKALWDYHYALSANAAKAYESISEEPGYSTLLEGDFKEIQSALRKAYPYAGFLSQSTRNELFRGPWIDHGDYRDDFDDTYAKNLHKLARLLENELDWVFPRRAGDRLRVLCRRWVGWRQEVKEAREKARMSIQRQKRALEAAKKNIDNEADKETGQ